LLEREIFGDTSGGTKAVFRAKRGTLEFCDHGTIFLDEITEMPLRLQERLAQVLRDRRFTRSGTAELVEVDIRVVAASSVSIREAVAGCRFLTDLSRQFIDHQLQVPALRERKDELPFLSRHFMHRLARRYGLPPREIAQSVSEAWQAHEWPGNLRELEQSVKRYLILGDELLGLQWSSVNGEDATPGRASARQSQTNGRRPIARSGCGMNACKPLRDLLQSVKAEAERAAIGLALERTGWNRKAAARLLKTSYRTVLYKIEQYQMSPSGSSSLQVANGLESEKAGIRGDRHRNAPAPDAPESPVVDSGRQFTL
jgi:two-component system response regulator AtoC